MDRIDLGALAVTLLAIIGILAVVFVVANEIGAKTEKPVLFNSQGGTYIVPPGLYKECHIQPGGICLVREDGTIVVAEKQ